ncbi:general stress protein [Salicibibacter halophilus]|uniref:General stress protein n=1 Tax=Salicibibacter halophilus TaxID=2502791 RepID=A0A514LN50_9BACI|nr:general stress protein [Salicibibacter halophilus]QDI92701.1 general stress protein [Salicibibacter halophilus]
MEPIYRTFKNDDEAVATVERLKGEVNENNIYVVTHDDDHTERVAKRADANTVGVSETGFGVSVKNIFRQKGDELRAKFEELHFSSTEAKRLEGELDKGVTIVVVKDAPSGLSL